MTIERQGREQWIECDTPGCNAIFEVGVDSFRSDWEKAKQEGWETKKIGSDWLHACPRHML